MCLLACLHVQCVCKSACLSARDPGVGALRARACWRGGGGEGGGKPPSRRTQSCRRWGPHYPSLCNLSVRLFCYVLEGMVLTHVFVCLPFFPQLGRSVTGTCSKSGGTSQFPSKCLQFVYKLRVHAVAIHSSLAVL